MNYHTLVNFPGGTQVDFGSRGRYRIGAEIEQGGVKYLVKDVTLNRERREQVVELRRPLSARRR